MYYVQEPLVFFHFWLRECRFLKHIPSLKLVGLDRYDLLFWHHKGLRDRDLLLDVHSERLRVAMPAVGFGPLNSGSEKEHPIHLAVL